MKRQERRKTHGEEEIGNVHGYVDGNAHVGEVEAVAQPDQGERDNVMQNQLLEIFTRLFEHQEQDNGLLCPVTGLQQIVCLEDALVAAVREALEHGRRVEVPDRAAAHDIQSKGAEDAKVDCRVELLHESCLLGLALDAETDGQRTDHTLHEELACEAQDNGIEGDECKVSLALAILQRLTLGGG